MPASARPPGPVQHLDAADVRPPRLAARVGGVPLRAQPDHLVLRELAGRSRSRKPTGNSRMNSGPSGPSRPHAGDAHRLPVLGRDRRVRLDRDQHGHRGPVGQRRHQLTIGSGTGRVHDTSIPHPARVRAHSRRTARPEKNRGPRRTKYIYRLTSQRRRPPLAPRDSLV